MESASIPSDISFMKREPEKIDGKARARDPGHRQIVSGASVRSTKSGCRVKLAILGTGESGPSERPAQPVKPAAERHRHHLQSDPAPDASRMRPVFCGAPEVAL